MSNLFIFHRDLRLTDNTTLIHQLSETKENVIPIFIFTPEQIDRTKNKYFSNNSVQFMIESLLELSNEITKKGGTLYFFKGDTLDILKKINEKVSIKSIGYNIDYTPYSKQRDKQIEKWCKSNQISLYQKEDYALYDFLDGQTLKKDKKPYLVYTPFMKFVSSSLKVRSVNTFTHFQFEKHSNLNSFSLKEIDLKQFYSVNEKINVKGGRVEGQSILDNLGKFKDYEKKRNILTYQTTHLSAYLHFTTCSIREVYWAIVKKLGKSSGILRELIFRDFYMNIVHYFPHTLEGQMKKGGNKSFRLEYDKIQWNKNKVLFEKWKNGKTGFPVVDAAMRQMNTTGFMHNRCRMIVSNFLVKDLHLDWKEGERYFATQLEDYDPINNSSGWQWSTGNGTDAQPYFRIFNPWTQQKDYDSQCEYIKHWLPELETVPPSDIHKWWDEKVRSKYSSNSYPSPIVNHDIERKKTLELYKKNLH
jgi:deoxyribodipyrimidine photo-lyase